MAGKYAWIYMSMKNIDKLHDEADSESKLKDWHGSSSLAQLPVLNELKAGFGRLLDALGQPRPEK